MSSGGTGFPWFDAIIAILGAGGVAAILTALFDYMQKRREETFEMVKQKLDVISKSLPVYIQLVSFYNAVALHLTKNPRDENQCLYFLCKLLMLQRSIFDKYGSLQLDDIDAETVVYGLGKEILNAIISKLGRENMNTMQNLVDHDADYTTFLRNLGGNSQLQNDFRHWLSEYDSVLPKGYVKPVSQLAQKCRWYAELILFEINHIYRYWYNEEPRFYGLSSGVISYLKDGYKEDDEFKSLDKNDTEDKRKLQEIEIRFTNYYNRILSFESRRPLRRKTRKI